MGEPAFGAARTGVARRRFAGRSALQQIAMAAAVPVVRRLPTVGTRCGAAACSIKCRQAQQVAASA